MRRRKFGDQAGPTVVAAAGRSLPAKYGLRLDVEASGLMAYGADLLDNGRRSVVFVDKIVKGAWPADLRVEQLSKFNGVINLMAAKALDLRIARTVRLRAEEVIA